MTVRWPQPASVGEHLAMEPSWCSREAGGEETITSQCQGELGGGSGIRHRQNNGGCKAHGLALGTRLHCAGGRAVAPEAAFTPTGGRGDADRQTMSESRMWELNIV
jgi:hypothetical protein